MNNNQPHRALWILGFALLALAGVLGGAGVNLGAPPDVAALGTLALDLVGMAMIVVGFGWAVTGQAGGIALSTWNDYSLSKLQMALWTIVVLGAYLAFVTLRLGLSTAVAEQAVKALKVAAKTAATAKAVQGSLPVSATAKVLQGTLNTALQSALQGALDVAVPGTLLTAMGISAFTTAATPSILALKADQQQPDEGQLRAARGRQDGFANRGRAAGYANASKAQWTDIITGDEVANAGTVDLTKVQHLLLTLLLLAIYVAMLVARLRPGPAAALLGLPDPGTDFVSLLAVSHAGYLVYKAAPKSGQSNTSPTAATGAAAPAAISLRLAIDGAAAITNLVLLVDDQSWPVDANGFAELTLGAGVRHVIVATGQRGGVGVRGTLAITPGPDDVNLALSLTLAPVLP